MALALAAMMTEPLPVIGLGDPVPTSVEVPGLAFPNLPGKAPVLSDTLPKPSTPGLEIYPIFIERQFSQLIGFIDSHGTTVVEPKYHTQQVCIGPDASAHAIVASRQRSTDVLDPATGALRWSSPTMLTCVEGSLYAQSSFQSEDEMSFFMGIVDLDTGRVAFEPSSTEGFNWIDAHTVDLVTYGQEGGVILDLDTGFRSPHAGFASGQQMWLPLPTHFSREAGVPAAINSDYDKSFFLYSSGGDEWTSEPFDGLVTWYNETAAVVEDFEQQLSWLQGRDGQIISGPFKRMTPIGSNRFKVCSWIDEEDYECVNEGVIDVDGHWVVGLGPDGQRLSIGDWDTVAPTRSVVFDPHGSTRLAYLDDWAFTPLPDVGPVVSGRTHYVDCPAIEPGEGASGFAGFVRPDASVVAFPDGYRLSWALTTDSSLEDRGCDIVEAAIPGEPEEMGEHLTFTGDGRRIPESIKFTFSLGPGLNWVKWGPYSGYLDQHGRWLYRQTPHSTLED